MKPTDTCNVMLETTAFGKMCPTNKCGRCNGSECMMWRWLIVLEDHDIHDPTFVETEFGYCGLAK